MRDDRIVRKESIDLLLGRRKATTHTQIFSENTIRFWSKSDAEDDDDDNVHCHLECLTFRDSDFSFGKDCLSKDLAAAFHRFSFILPSCRGSIHWRMTSWSHLLCLNDVSSSSTTVFSRISVLVMLFPHEVDPHRHYSNSLVLKIWQLLQSRYWNVLLTGGRNDTGHVKSYWLSSYTMYHPCLKYIKSAVLTPLS